MKAPKSQNTGKKIPKKNIQPCPFLSVASPSVNATSRYKKRPPKPIPHHIVPPSTASRQGRTRVSHPVREGASSRSDDVWVALWLKSRTALVVSTFGAPSGKGSPAEAMGKFAPIGRYVRHYLFSVEWSQPVASCVRWAPSRNGADLGRGTLLLDPRRLAGDRAAQRGQGLDGDVRDHHRHDDQRRDPEAGRRGEKHGDDGGRQRELQDRDAGGGHQHCDRRRLGEPGQVRREHASDEAEEQGREGRAPPEVAQRDAPGESLEQEQERECPQGQGRGGLEDR